MVIFRFGRGLRLFLQNPGRVLMVCVAFLAVSVLLDGVLWRLWGLHRDVERLQSVIASTQNSIGELNRQLHQAKDPVYIEREARDRLDLVSQNDLVFVFPEE